MRPQLAGYDDDALAALANKGLVRRATKDAAKTPPVVQGETAETVTLAVGGETVTLRQPVASSTCTCDAGMCRHILAAIIFLRDQSPADAGASDGKSNADLVAELLAIDEEQILAWAGKPTLKKAAVFLPRGAQVEIGDDSIRVTLSGPGITVRYLGGGIDAMLCDCHAAGACPHKVAALLAFRAEQTGEPIALEPIALQEKAGVTRTRDGVRLAVLTLLDEMVTLGLSRLTPAIEGRLRTLATSAHGVDLPRLQRLLESLAEQVRLVNTRHAAGDTMALLASAGRAYALCHALAKPTAALVGEHRGVYLPIRGQVQLLGLGAARWQTGSGYHGITLYFWEPEAARWTSWTDARPADLRSFDPAARFEQESPWTGALSARQAAGRAWRVTNLHRNAEGRITTRDNTRGLDDGVTDPAAGPLVTSFAELAAMRETLLDVSLSRPAGQLSSLAVVRPAALLPASYDHVQQIMSRPMVDDAGDMLLLSINHGPAAGDSLSILKSLPEDVSALFVRLRRDGSAEPITAWHDGGPLHLTLDSALAKNASADADTQPDVSVGGDSTTLALRLDEALAGLRDSAEAGLAAGRPWPEVPVSLPPVEQLPRSDRLLRTAYLLDLARQAC